MQHGLPQLQSALFHGDPVGVALAVHCAVVGGNELTAVVAELGSLQDQL